MLLGIRVICPQTGTACGQVDGWSTIHLVTDFPPRVLDVVGALLYVLGQSCNGLSFRKIYRHRFSELRLANSNR